MFFLKGWSAPPPEVIAPDVQCAFTQDGRADVPRVPRTLLASDGSCFDSLSVPAAGWAWLGLDRTSLALSGNVVPVPFAWGAFPTAAAGEHAAIHSLSQGAPADLEAAGPLIVDNIGVRNTAQHTSRRRCGPQRLYGHFWSRVPPVDFEWFRAHQSEDSERTQAERARYDANLWVDLFAKAGSQDLKI